LRHTVVYLAQLEHHFRYRFRSHLRQIEQTFTQDLDIEKKMTLRKYSNFRHEVGKASVGDPSIICARQWETSK
jgi:tryptophan 2,3-dioxygenase